MFLVFVHSFLLMLPTDRSFFNWNYMILCSAKDDYNIDKESYHSLTISSDGGISRYFPTIYKSSCKLDVRNFPFDDQVTTLDDH